MDVARKQYRVQEMWKMRVPDCQERQRGWPVMSGLQEEADVTSEELENGHWFCWELGFKETPVGRV